LSGLDGSQASRLSDLVDPINGFFDQVLVMDKDESLKNNRLALLAMVRELFGRVADFSKITE
ncbi:MAG: DALR anticodon-binding domain-containing protein, partial [Thermodesulfobacteriota bacterium]